MTVYICDCGQRHYSLAAVESCQIGGHPGAAQLEAADALADAAMYDLPWEED